MFEKLSIERAENRMSEKVICSKHTCLACVRSFMKNKVFLYFILFPRVLKWGQQFVPGEGETNKSHSIYLFAISYLNDLSKCLSPGIFILPPF